MLDKVLDYRTPGSLAGSAMSAARPTESFGSVKRKISTPLLSQEEAAGIGEVRVPEFDACWQT